MSLQKLFWISSWIPQEEWNWEDHLRAAPTVPMTQLPFSFPCLHILLPPSRHQSEEARWMCQTAVLFYDLRCNCTDYSIREKTANSQMTPCEHPLVTEGRKNSLLQEETSSRAGSAGILQAMRRKRSVLLIKLLLSVCKRTRLDLKHELWPWKPEKHTFVFFKISWHSWTCVSFTFFVLII